MAKFLESIGVSDAGIGSPKAPNLVGGFYSGGNPAGPVATAPGFNKLITNNHLSQKRLFRASLRTVNPQTKDWKPKIADQTRQNAWRKPPLSS